METPSRPQITPDLKVGELLAAFPELESVLVAQAPAFRNLANPVLRRTVAKVATLAQAARVGGVEVRTLVRTLRSAAGQPVDDEGAGPGEAAGAESPPAWFREVEVVATLDAGALLARGDHPLGEVTRLTSTLEVGQAVCVDSEFVPAPMVDALRGRGFEAATFRHGAAGYRTCIRRAAGQGG